MMVVAMCFKNVFLVMLFGNLLSLTDCQLEAFKELQEVDKEISTSFSLLLDVVEQANIGVGEVQKHIIKDGSMTSAVFKPTKQTKDGLNRELHAGLTFQVIEIPEQYKRLVEDVGGKDGFVKIRANMDAFKLLDSLHMKVDLKEYAEVLPYIVKDGYLMPYRLRERVLKKLEETVDALSSYSGVAKLFLSAALNTDLDSIKLSQPPHEDSKLPTSSYVDIIVDNKLKLKFSWDVGTVIKLNWWPRVAQEWIDRKREWPSKDTITSLTRSSYITKIPSDRNDFDKDSVELIYSFAHAERALIAERSSQQSLVYLVFNSMMYRWIKPISSDRVHSRIANNIMLWTCEEFPPDHLLWSDKSAEQALSVLFGKLLEALEMKKLPNYFVPKVNVLENIDEDVRVREVVQVKRMLTDISKYVPDNAKDVTKVCRDMLSMIQSSNKVLQEIANENYDIFLQRPDLIPKALEIFGLNFLGGLGNKKKEDLHKTLGDVKDTLSQKWSEFQEDLNMDEHVDNVHKTVKETIEQVKDNFDLDDIEKKAKDWLKKWEL